MTTQFSALRDSIIQAMTDDPAVPLSFVLPPLPPSSFSPSSPTYKTDMDAYQKDQNSQIEASLELEDTARKLGLLGEAHSKILPIAKRIELNHLLPSNCKYDFNGRPDILGWIISNCTIDSAGLPLFEPNDVAVIVGKYSSICYYMAWEALDVNNFTNKASQATVGN